MLNNPYPSFQVYNTLGQPLAQVSVVLDSTYNADEVTSFPTDVFPDLRKSGGITTDATGIATFTDIKVILFLKYNNIDFFFKKNMKKNIIRSIKECIHICIFKPVFSQQLIPNTRI